MVSGRPLVFVLILLTVWFLLLCGVVWKALKARKSARGRNHATIAGLGCAAIAVGALLGLHLTWISPTLSQHLGAGTIRILALFLFWPTLIGFALNVGGAGRIRFLGIATCFATGLWWFTLAMGSAISVGPPMTRHPTSFLIPNAYVGWITIDYRRNAPPLEMSDGKYICRVPATGVVATSSTLEEGWAKDEYFYYSEDGSVVALPDTGWGGGGMIWAGSDSLDSQKFFVGREDQFRHNEGQSTRQ